MGDFANYSNKEIGDIWDRISKKVSVSNIKGKTKEEVIDNLESELRNIPKDPNKSGNAETLINKGFAKRFVEVETGKDFYSEKRTISTYKGKPAEYVSDPKTGKRLTWRLINIKKSTFRGKPAEYVSDAKTGKRLRMRLIK